MEMQDEPVDATAHLRIALSHLQDAAGGSVAAEASALIAPLLDAIANIHRAARRSEPIGENGMVQAAEAQVLVLADNFVFRAKVSNEGARELLGTYARHELTALSEEEERRDAAGADGESSEAITTTQYFLDDGEAGEQGGNCTANESAWAILIAAQHLHQTQGTVEFSSEELDDALSILGVDRVRCVGRACGAALRRGWLERGVQDSSRYRVTSEGCARVTANARQQ
jgi:hypothetical protein